MSGYQHSNSLVNVKNLLAAPSRTTRRLPGPFQEFDNVGGAADWTGIFARRDLFHRRFGQHRKVAFLHPHVAQARRATQLSNQLSYGVDRGSGPLVYGHTVAFDTGSLCNQGQTVSRHRPVEFHRMREHDAGGLPVRYVAMAAELVPNGVTDACAHAAE